MGRLVSIKNPVGSAAADQLVGDALANMLSGGSGDDTLIGAAGDDPLVPGSGNDTVSVGVGDDRIVAGSGRKVIDGDAGFDTLDFGTARGAVSLPVAAGSYGAQIVTEIARCSDRDLDGDGTEDSNGQEGRLFGGVTLPPAQLLEADARYSNSADDVLRLLPEADSPA
nr:hypothetical protein [Salipiger mangrovisoli]